MSESRLNSALTMEEWEALEAAVFGDANATLQRLRDFARGRHLPPIPFLITACLRVLSSLPGSVTFDAGVGPGSLNLFVALVGRPGQGKDRLMSATNQSVSVRSAGTLLHPEELALGSGEGVAGALSPEEGQSTSPPVLFGASEVGEVDALMGRTGATLRGNMLKIYSGNSLGFTNKGDKFVVPAHSYTAGFWVGVQPDKAGVLLDGEDDGFRHRFIWTELLDPTRPRIVAAAEPLGPIDLPLEVVAGSPIGFDSEIVRDTVNAMDVTLRLGVQGENSGHRHQTKLKLAAGLALLDSRGNVDADDWHRAEALMVYSERVQDNCLAHLQKQRVNDAAERQARKEQATEQADVKRRLRLRRKILDQVGDGSTPKRSDVLQALRSDSRAVMAQLLGDLESEGLIEKVVGDQGAVFIRRSPSFGGT